MAHDHAPSLDNLRLAWERHLLAKVQIIELQSWGDSTVGLIRQTVEEYRTLEEAYVQEMVRRRREHADNKKNSARR